MKANRRNLVVLVVGMTALALTTGWASFKGDVWPPEAYQVYSPAGAWTDIDGTGNISIITLSPPDPRTHMGSGMATEINVDPTLDGMIPEATSWSSGFMTYVMTGPDTGRVRGIYYVMKDEKPKPLILSMLVLDLTPTFSAPDTLDYQATISAYMPSADKDGDGLPDDDETPLISLPMAGHMKRI